MLTNLAKTRLELGLTQKQLAAMVGQNPTAMSWYENDAHIPRLDTAVNLADALDVTVDYLIGREDAAA